MTKAILFYRNSLLTKLFMLVILIVGRGNFLSLSAQKALPYEYGFENNNLASEGWTIIDGITNTSIVKSGTYGVQVRTGDYSFRFYSGYNKTEYLVSPILQTSSTGIDISFYYKNTSSSSKETFYIGYSTTEGEGEPQMSSFTWLDDALVPAASMSDFQKYSTTINNISVKYIAIKHVSANSHNVFIDDVTIEAAETYKRPKALNVSSYTSSTATLSWTAGSDESAWEIAYSTKEDFDPQNEGVRVPVSNNPYTLSGLVESVTYYAYVRSNYSGNYSAWSNKVELTPLLVETVNANGSNTNTSIPIIDRTYSESYMQTQFIIPASNVNLTNIQNTIITKLTFYCSQNSINWNGATFEVYMKEVDKTIYNTLNLDTEWGTKVFNSGVLSVSNGQMVIEFNTPFSYTTGNLMIGFKQTHISGDENNTTPIGSTWYGTTQATYSDYTAIYYGMGYSSVSTNRINFIPKVTFTTISPTVSVTLGLNGYTTFASPRPLDLTDENIPDGLTAYKAAVDGSTVRFTKINQTVAANTGILLEGAAKQTYNIPVAESGTDVVGNEFLVNSTGGTFTADDGYTYFGMKKATSASDALVFASFAPSSVAIPTDKAYLKVLTSSLPATSRQLVCSFDDETPTGISATLNDRGKTINEKFIYNLNGQRVNKPSKGLYIVNGKKVIIK